MNRRRLSFAMAAALALAMTLVIGAGCKKSDNDGPLPALDTAPSEAGIPFDPNNLIDTPSFTDYAGIDSVELQKFLQLTPYDHPSFLETYSSNGLVASDAITEAARKYRINPLIFLVEAEAVQALVNATTYPSQASTVEYVFRCGCSTPTICDPALAGFDRQVDCLGAELRASLDQIATNGATAGGWAPGTQLTTEDGVKITPGSEATAALYQLLPVVGMGGTNGNWVVWNIYQLYSSFLGYAGAIGGGSPTAWVGDPCSADPQCSYQGGQCITGYPGGMCSAQCTGTDCPTDPSKPQNFCGDFGAQGGYCVLVCNPNAPACRSGYTCTAIGQFATPNSPMYACVAQ